MQNKCLEFALSLFLVAGVAFSPLPSTAQAPGEPQVNMILFPVMRDQDNQQYIISRAGYKINIQGVGIAKDAKQIAVYQDNQNNFWYINKKGEPTEVNPEQMQKMQAQIQAQQMMQQQGAAGGGGANPNANPQNVTVNNYGSGSGSGGGNSGSSALGTGLAAMGGAMGGAALGAAMTNSMYNQPYYGVPYGHPIYREPTSGNYYYHGASGNNVYVKPTENTAAMFNQYNQQGAWKDRDQWQNNPNWNKEHANTGMNPNMNPNMNKMNPNMNGNMAGERHEAEDGGRKFGNRFRGGNDGAASANEERRSAGRENGGGRRFGGGRFR
ncbi:MAG TPA: hypothetical protein V6C89_05235 [Drouetiella sp.]|jgi:hypothetical protein